MRISENPKKLYSAMCRTKMDYGYQLYNTASAWKKLDSIHREGIGIYEWALKILPVEALHVKANDLLLHSVHFFK